MLYIFEDTEAVIEMIVKGKSPFLIKTTGDRLVTCVAVVQRQSVAGAPRRAGERDSDAGFPPITKEILATKSLRQPLYA